MILLSLLVWTQFEVAYPTFGAIVTPSLSEEIAWFKMHFSLETEKKMEVNESLTIEILAGPNLAVELLSTDQPLMKKEGQLKPGIMKLGIPTKDLNQAFQYAKQQKLDLVTPIIEEDLMRFFILRSPSGFVLHVFHIKGDE